MKQIIEIDKSSIELNENAGRTQYLIPGKIMNNYDKDGKLIEQHRNIQHVKELTLEPKYFFNYKDTLIKCEGCQEEFPRTNLKADYTVDKYGNEIHSNEICPKCGLWDCANIFYEGFNKNMIK